jgi:hypothetical protein
MKSKKIRISPLVRLKLSFDSELNLDKYSIFGRDTYEKYLEVQREAEIKQDQLLRSMFFLNALLFLVVNGQDWSIPIIDLQISSIPAVLEILLFASTIAFFFLCVTFVTNQCYIGIIDQFGNRIVDSNLIDPDFFNASRKPYDFFLKIFRPKLNFWGEDFYEAGKGFKVFCHIISVLVVVVVLSFPTVHIALSWAASMSVYSSDLNKYAMYLFLSIVWLINFGSVMIIIGMSKEFEFEIRVFDEDSNSSTKIKGDHKSSSG